MLTDAEHQANNAWPPSATDPGPRALLRAMLAELLPVDAVRRTRHLVYAAYFLEADAAPLWWCLVRSNSSSAGRAQTSQERGELTAEHARRGEAGVVGDELNLWRVPAG
jgi:hypothetical protein